MAGLGKKTFTAGAVLTASDVNGYLMEQAVMVFGGTAARSSAIPSPSEGMFTYRTDTDVIEYYNGSTWTNIIPTTSVIAAKTGAYTLASGDENDLIELNGTFTVSVPLDSTFNFPIGTQINILNIGTGVITTAGVGGVTLNGTPGLKLRAQWSSATFIKRAANTWVIVGDLLA